MHGGKFEFFPILCQVQTHKLLIELNELIMMYVIYLQVYVGALSLHYEALSVEASKQTTAEEIVSCIVERLGLTVSYN